MKNVKQYYKELGKLLYAIAMADGVVQPEEAYTLHQFVTRELAHNEKTYDSSGMNQAFYVDFEFDDLVEKHPPLNGTVRHFNTFIEAHVEAGDEALVDRSIAMMEAVTHAYSKAKEKQILDQVKQVTDHLLQLKGHRS